jgi:SSS family solute:Na+ symporter
MVNEGIISLPANVTNPPDYSFIVAAEHVFPDFFAPLVAIIVLSAVMSTTDRLMLTIGSYVSWDVYKQFVNKEASEKSITLLSRVAIVISTVITLYLARYPPDLLAWLIWAGIAVMLACFVTPLFAGLYWRRATREGALASMIVGLVGVSAISYAHYMKLIVLPMHPGIYGFALSVLAMIVVSLATKKPSEKLLDETKTGMFIRDKKA